jgi:hypothetical protein
MKYSPNKGFAPVIIILIIAVIISGSGWYYFNQKESAENVTKTPEIHTTESEGKTMAQGTWKSGEFYYNIISNIIVPGTFEVIFYNDGSNDVFFTADIATFKKLKIPTSDNYTTFVFKDNNKILQELKVTKEDSADQTRAGVSFKGSLNLYEFDMDGKERGYSIREYKIIDIGQPEYIMLKEGEEREGPFQCC